MGIEDIAHDMFKAAFNKFQFKAIALGVAVNVSDTKFDVVRDGESKVTGVRLFAEDEIVDSFFVVKPKENSNVLIGFYENDEKEAILLMCSNIDEVYIKIGNAVFRLKEKFSFKKGSNSIKDIFKLIIEAVQQIFVLYGNNPNFSKLQQALDKIENLFE